MKTYDPMINTETLRRDYFYAAMRPSKTENLFYLFAFAACVLMAFVAVWG